MKRLIVLMMAVFCVALFSNALFAADQFTFQYGKNNYEATKDTHITGYSGNNMNNMGGNVENECCEYNPANNDPKSVLIQFDLSAIKKGSIISKATLSLYLNSTRNGTNKKSVEAHRLLKDWAEGAGTGIDGVAAKANEVCGLWTGVGGANWDKVCATSAGQDFVEKADSTTEIAGDVGWYDWNITPSAAFWINHPDQNFGVILSEALPHVPTLGTKVFAAKEGPSLDNHPKLIVEVSALGVPEDSVATLWGRVKSN